MDLIADLRERRVPQYLSAYIVGGWGLVQAVTFMEGRMGFSPNVVNLLALTLLLLLPGVALLAWRQGRPGPDGWGKIELISLPANLMLAAAILFFIFQGQDFGAVAKTVTVTDENGETVERTVVKGEYRRRLMLFYLENEGPAEDDWLRKAFTAALSTDFSQNPSVDVETPMQRVAALRIAGFEDGLGVPRPLMRKIAQDTYCPRFMTGTLNRVEGLLQVGVVLHDTERGSVLAEHQVTGDDFFKLVDEISVLIQDDLDLPAFLKENAVDHAVSDQLTDDIEAYREFMQAIDLATHHNDWEAARGHADRAVELDPTFAIAHFLRYGIYFSAGDVEEGTAAMKLAMKHLYRLSERTQLQIKALYYFNIKSDPDKAMAVLDMWTRLYPEDVAGYQHIAQFSVFRGDIETAISATETILSIDPTQHQFLQELANLHIRQGNFDKAEKHLNRYAELYPNDPRSYRQLADLNEDAGRLEKAKANLEKSLLIEPDALETRLQLAGLEKKLGHFDQTREILAEIVAEDPAEDLLAEALSEQAALLELLGQWKAARGKFEQWREVAARVSLPTQTELGYLVVVSRMATALTAEEVLADLERVGNTLGAPNDQVLGMCRAEVMAVQGRTEEARAALKQTEDLIDTYKLEVMRPMAQRVEALIASAEGRPEEGARLMREAVAANPGSTSMRYNLGRMQREADQLKEAAETQTEVLRAFPAHPMANLEMARVLAETGRASEALPHLEAVETAWADADEDHPGLVAMRELQDKLQAQ